MGATRKVTRKRKHPKRSWYAVRMLFECLHPEENIRMGTFEDRIVLFKAVSLGEAKRKAARYGKGEWHQYKNMYGKKVVWVFRRVLDAVELFDNRISQGTEVYWQFLNKTRLKLIERTLRPLGR